MKPQPLQNLDLRDAARSSPRTQSTGERAMHATSRRGPPGVPHRRYPSLSDDGQPYFPRARWQRGPAPVPPPAAHAPLAGWHARVTSVRVFAVIAIIVIIAVLAASA